MSGRGTSGGVLFQAEVGAYVAALLLTERPISRLGDKLPGTPLKLILESPSAVDDINVITDKGLIYIQAKRTVSLSDNLDSELGSVADQFVRQFREGAPHGSTRRKMTVSTDRLVLAVGGTAPSTIRYDLREALARTRTGAATALPQNLTKALATFTKLISDAWEIVEGSPIDSKSLNEILTLSSVVVLDDNQKQLATEALRDVVQSTGDEVALSDLLIEWATRASQDGTGGDKAAIRLYLQEKTLLKEPPSYKADVERLLQYNDKVIKRLSRFSAIKTDAGDISFVRPVSSIILKAAGEGSLVITGDPGSGKSGIIHALSASLPKDVTVITLTAETNAINLEALQKEIGLEHPLIEVFQNISLSTKGYLILDALDATRGGIAEATYKTLVQEIAQLPNWHVVASVRTFDLRLGLEWRKLFLGVPPDPNYSEPDFKAVRHVHVPLLSDSELKDIESTSPSLKAALAAGGSKMSSLARNPFNLALIGELLSGGIAPESLSSVSTRSDLLSRYWNERIDDLGLSGRIALKTFVELIVSKRAIDIPDTNIPITAAQTIQELEARGVLVTEQTHRIGFRHHILFDYAVSRLLLEPSPREAILHLSKEVGAGLLISPSLEFWIEHLKATLGTNEFWKVVTSIIASDDTDPIIRVEISRIAVESVEAGEDLQELASVLSNEPTAKKAIMHIAGTIRTFGLRNGHPDDWALMISNISDLTENFQLGSLRVIIDVLFESELSEKGLDAVGISSRKLFDAMSTEESRIHWLASSVVPFVAKTFATNPEESRLRIEQIFLPDRFKKSGYVEVPWLSREVRSIGDHDGDLVAKIYHTAFSGADFSKDQTTSMGGNSSWILNLTSNAGQDFSMAEYTLSTEYPELLLNTPTAGIKALAATLDAKNKSDRRGVSTDAPAIEIPFNGSSIQFIEDHSAIWGWDLETGNDGESKIYKEYLSWVETVEEQILLTIPETVFSQCTSAVAWKALFDAGTKRPDSLGKRLVDSAYDENILKSMNTRQSAIKMIAATYPHLSREKQREIETSVLSYEFKDARDPEFYKTSVVGTVLNAIGEHNLVTDQTKAFLKKVKDDGEDLSNPKPCEFGSDWTSDNDSSETVSYDSDDLNALIEASNAFAKKSEETDSEDDTWTKTQNLISAKDNVTDPIPDEIDNSVAVTLAKSLSDSLLKGVVPQNEQDSAIDRLLQLSRHNDPVANEDTEASFARFPSWGGNSARIEVADALGQLVGNPAIWPKISSRYKEMLLSDPHPAVRMMLGRRLSGLWFSDKDALWDVTANFLSTEQNPAVLEFAAHDLNRLRDVASDKIETVFLDLSKKNVSSSHGKRVIPATIGYFAISKELPASVAEVENWLADFVENEQKLHDLLFNMRSAFCIGYAGDDVGQETLRKNTIKFLWRLIDTVEPAVKSWPASGKEPTEIELAALKLFNEIADQMYYAVVHEKSGIVLQTKAEQIQFLDEYAPIISKLTTLGTPKAVHHCLEVIEHFIHVDPIRYFDLFSEAMLRTTGVAKYEHESMGAKLFVKLVGIYIADYRFIFNDADRRKKLIECLAVFVEAGWPEARRLFQNLSELR